MTISDSDVIIGTFNMVGAILDRAGDFLSNDVVLITTMTIIGTLLVAHLGNKLKEIELSRLRNKYEIEEQKLQNKKNIALQKEIVLKKKGNKESAQEKLSQAQINKAKIEALIIEAEAKGNSKKALKLKKQLVRAESDEKQAQDDLNEATEALKQEEEKLKIFEKESDLIKGQSSLIDSIRNGLSIMTTPLMVIVGLWKTISSLITIVGRKQKRQSQESIIQAGKETVAKSFGAAAQIIKDLGV